MSQTFALYFCFNIAIHNKKKLTKSGHKMGATKDVKFFSLCLQNIWKQICPYSNFKAVMAPLFSGKTFLFDKKLALSNRT